MVNLMILAAITLLLFVLWDLWGEGEYEEES